MTSQHKKQNKTQFILANRGLGTPAIVAKAKRYGLEMSTSYVSSVLWKARISEPKASGKTNGHAKGRIATTIAPAAALNGGGELHPRAVPHGEAEVELKAAIERVGFTRARAIFAELVRERAAELAAIAHSLEPYKAQPFTPPALPAETQTEIEPS